MESVLFYQPGKMDEKSKTSNGIITPSLFVDAVSAISLKPGITLSSLFEHRDKKGWDARFSPPSLYHSDTMQSF
jgi:hypothetical protein